MKLFIFGIHFLGQTVDLQIHIKRAFHKTHTLITAVKQFGISDFLWPFKRERSLKEEWHREFAVFFPPVIWKIILYRSTIQQLNVNQQYSIYWSNEGIIASSLFTFYCVCSFLKQILIELILFQTLVCIDSTWSSGINDCVRLRHINCFLTSKHNKSIFIFCEYLPK